MFWAGGSDEQLPAVGGRGCHKFVPALGGSGTKIAPPGDIFDQPPGEMSSIQGKLADHVDDHAVLSPYFQHAYFILIVGVGKRGEY